MAEVVKHYEFIGAGRPGAHHDWSKWFDGRTWRLKRGKDFTSKIISFTMAAYKRANRYGGHVQINKDEDKGVVYLRFFKNGRKGNAP